MSSRASGGALAASLITAAIIGFAGGAYFGTQTGNASSSSGDSTGDDSSSAPEDDQSGGNDGGEDSTEDDSGEVELSLALNDAQQTKVAPGDCVDVSGALNPPVAAVKVQLQRSVEGGDWERFPSIDPWTTDENGEFGGFACSQREGVNALRVVRNDDDSVVSEPVEVSVG